LQAAARPAQAFTIKLAYLRAALVYLVAPAAFAAVVAWNSVPSVKGYNLYYGPSTKFYTNVISTTGTNLTLNLAPGTYYLVVHSINDFGESDPSNEIIVVQLPKPTIIGTTVRVAPSITGPWTSIARFTVTNFTVNTGTMFFKADMDIQ
jgi:hypothetical protein